MISTGKLLCDLIALPSVNPAFLPPRDPRGGERQVAEFLAARAARAKLDVEFQPVQPHRTNLFVRLTPSGPVRHRLLLAPHLDTVGGEEPLADLLTPQRRGNRVYGRGACDTKGSVAAMFEALCQLARQTQRPAHTEIVFAGLADEECGQTGSRALVANGWRADFAIVGEPTRLKVVTAHKGALWMELTTRGRAAHGARPELGRNAIHRMARVVEALHTDYAASLHRRKHALLGSPSLNIGSIQGGRQPNIVPAECVITLDRRTVPGEQDARVMAGIRTFLCGRGLPVRLRRLRPEQCFPLATDRQLDWVQRLFRAARQTAAAGVDYFSDAGVLAHGGIPSVVFGPGDIAQAHTPNEWIELKQVERARDILVHYLHGLP